MNASMHKSWEFIYWYGMHPSAIHAQKSQNSMVSVVVRYPVHSAKGPRVSRLILPIYIVQRLILSILLFPLLLAVGLLASPSLRLGVVVALCITSDCIVFLAKWVSKRYTKPSSFVIAYLGNVIHIY